MKFIQIDTANRYRNILVQIGSFIGPDTKEIPALVARHYFNMSQIKEPVIKVIYFHQELKRIHSFLDGKRRTHRIANKWILMYDLYCSIFIKNTQEKKEYNKALSKNFRP